MLEYANKNIWKNEHETKPPVGAAGERLNESHSFKRFVQTADSIKNET